MRATALAAALYTRPEAFRRERRSIFQNAWLMLARAAQVAAPGSYVAQSLGGWPVFAIADARGEPHAFRNVCRHQGLPIFDSGGGSCAELRCRYHGWRYDAADGRFLEAPAASAPPDPGNPLHGLERVALESAEGVLLVHLGEPRPLDRAALVASGIGTLPFAGESQSDIDANWKLVLEAMLGEERRLGERSLLWPSLLLEHRPGAALLHQVIPRAFQRTRIHHHRYGDAAAPETGELRAAALAAQAALAGVADVPPADDPAVAAFRAEIAAAHPS